MAIVPTSLARVSNTLRTSVTTQTLAKTQLQLLQVQNQLTTGLKIATPSEDPGSASVIMQLQKTLESRQAYLDNINQASGQLSQVDSTIDGVEEVLGPGDAATVHPGRELQVANPFEETAEAIVCIRSDMSAFLADGTPLDTPPWAR